MAILNKIITLLLVPLFSLYFIRGGYLVTGTFSHIYAMPEGWNTENGKGVCTRVASRVHTVGGVSSDILL